jgi:hypothetical protein
VFLNEFFRRIDRRTDRGSCLIDDITGNAGDALGE